MLCQKCGHLEATVHREETVFRRKIEQHLCALCAGTGDGALPPEEELVTFIPYTSQVKRLGVVPPLECAAKGLVAIPDYMARLYAADAFSSALWVHPVTVDAPMISVFRDNGSPAILMLVVGEVTARSENVREFLSRHNVPPVGVSQETPWPLLYPLPPHPDDAVRLVIGVLTLCFNVSEHDPLRFRVGHFSIAEK